MVPLIVEKGQGGVSQALRAQDHKEALEGQQELRVPSVALAPWMTLGSLHHQALERQESVYSMPAACGVWHQAL